MLAFSGCFIFKVFISTVTKLHMKRFCLLSRFYFVGDEDLLEIIGNSKNVPKLQKHFKKMFAGISSVVLSEDETKVLGICSREGEIVREQTSYYYPNSYCYLFPYARCTQLISTV